MLSLLVAALVVALVVQHHKRPRRAEEEWRALDARYRDALSKSNERVETGGRLIAAQEAERKRIARELHDDLSQKLALLSIDIDQIPRRPRNKLAERVRNVSERAAEIATDVHHLAYQLHPSTLESLGLVTAIQRFSRDMSNQHDLEVEFDHYCVPSNVRPDIALCVYRIVQEGLHNVVRHSGAGKASVQLSATDGVIDCDIADPGKGFTIADLRHPGIDLISMRERVNFVGGQMVVHSAPGKGTRIGVRARINDDVALDAPEHSNTRLRA